MSAGAEQVLVARVLEDARRAAIEEDRQLLELIGERRNRQAVAGGDVSDHRIDILTLHQIAILRHLLGRAAGLVDDGGFDGHAVNAFGRIRRRQRTGIERLDGELRRVARGHPERSGGRAGEERHDPELERARLLGMGGERGKRGEHDRSADPAMKA